MAEPTTLSTDDQQLFSAVVKDLEGAGLSREEAREEATAHFGLDKDPGIDVSAFEALPPTPAKEEIVVEPEEEVEDTGFAEEVEEAEPVVEEPIVVEPEVVEMPDRPEQVRAERPTSQVHLNRDFDLEPERFLRLYKSASTSVRANTWFEEDQLEALDRARVRELDKHAKRLGLKSAQELQDAAKVQGIGLESLMNEIDAGRPVGDLIKEARDRGIYPFLETEREKEAYAVSDDARRKQIAHYLRTGEGPAPETLLDTPKMGLIQEAEHMPMLGLEVGESKGVTQPGEKAHTFSLFLSQKFMEDPEIAALINAYSSKERGIDHFVPKRAAQIAKRRGLVPGTPEYIAAVRSLRSRALREVAALKAVGIWTAPAFLPEADFFASPEGRSQGQRIYEAFSPTIEIVGLAERGGKYELVVRQESPLLYVFNMADSIQAAAIGLIEEGSMIEGIAKRRNALEVSIDSDFAQGGMPQKILAGVGGFGVAVLAPDLFSVASWAYKAPAKIAGALAKVGIRGRAARRAISLLDEIAVARAENRLEDAAITEMKLREEFAQRGGLADLLDAVDADVAKGMAETFPDIFDVKLARGLPDEAGRRALSLHPSGRKIEMEEGLKEGEELIFSNYKELFSTHLHLDELAAVRRALVDQGSAARLPLLRKAVHQNLTKLDELLDTKMDVEAAAFMNVIRDTLSDALENPKAWRNRIHGAGNVDNELLKVKSLRGPTVEEVNAATGRKKSELILKQKLLEKKRHAIHKEIGRIVTKVTKAEDPILTVDRAIEALKASNESRAMAAELLKFAIMGREKIKPFSALARPGTKEVKELSGEGHLFAKNIAKAFGLDEEQALFVARVTDARARVWATINNKDPGEWYRTRIQAVTRLVDETSLPDNILRQMLEEQGDAAIFYSGLRAATEDLPENIRVDSVINTLKKSKAAPVTEDEIRDTGLRIWLDEQKAAGKSRITREEMLAFLDDHSAGVEVISLGEVPAGIRNKIAELRPTFSAWTNLLQSSGYEAGATHEILSAVRGGKSPWKAVVEAMPNDVRNGGQRATLFNANMLTSVAAADAPRRISEGSGVPAAFADAIKKRAGARLALVVQSHVARTMPTDKTGLTIHQKLTKRLAEYDAAHKEYMRLFDELDDEILFENVWTKMGDVDAEKFADDVGLDEAVAADGGVYATIQGTPIDQRFMNPATIGVEMDAMRAMARADLEAHAADLKKYFRPLLDDRTKAVQKGAAELELLTRAAGVRHPRWPEYTMGAPGRVYAEEPEDYAELLITVPKRYRKAPVSMDWRVEPSDIPTFSAWLKGGQGMTAADLQLRALKNYGLSMDDYSRMAAGKGGPSHFVWGALNDLPRDVRAQIGTPSSLGGSLFVDASTPGSPRVLIGIGNSQEEALNMARTKRAGSYGGKNHYESVGDDAIMAHVRVSTRKGPNGERLLFLEEIQSDWHQGARKVARGMEDMMGQWKVGDEWVSAKGKLSGYQVFAEDIIEQDPALLDDMTDLMHRYLEFDAGLPRGARGSGPAPATLLSQNLHDQRIALRRALADFGDTRLLNAGLSSTLEAEPSMDFGVRLVRHPELETTVNARQGEYAVGAYAPGYLSSAPTAEGRKALLRQQAGAYLTVLTELHNSSAKTAYTRGPLHFPKAPWADDWYKLAIKRAVRYASDHGYDGVAVTKSDIITPLVTGPHSSLMDGKRMMWEASALLEEATQHPAWANPVRLSSRDREMWKVGTATPGAVSSVRRGQQLKDYGVAQGRADARKAVLAEVMEKRGLKLGDSDATDAVYDAYAKNDFDIPWDSQSARPSRDINLGVGMMDPTQDGQLEFIQELVRDGHARIYRGNRAFYEGTVPGYLRSYLRGFEAKAPKGAKKAPEMAGVPPPSPKRKGAKAMAPFSLQEAQDSRAKAEKIANEIATALDEAIDTSKMSFDDLLLYLQEERARRAAWPVGRTRLPDMEHVRETQRQGFRVESEGYDPHEVYERVFPAADVVMFTDNMKTQAAKRATLYQRADHRMEAGEGFYSAASRAVEKLFGEPHTTPKGTRYGPVEGGPIGPIGVDVEAIVPAKDLFRTTKWAFVDSDVGDLLMTDLSALDYSFEAASKLKEMKAAMARRLATHMDEAEAEQLAYDIAVDLDTAYELERPASLIALLQRGEMTEEVAEQLWGKKVTHLNLDQLDPKSVPNDMSRESLRSWARAHYGDEVPAGRDTFWDTPLVELDERVASRMDDLELGVPLDTLPTVGQTLPKGIDNSGLLARLSELRGWITSTTLRTQMAESELEPLIHALKLLEKETPGMVTEELLSVLGLRPRVAARVVDPEQVAIRADLWDESGGVMQDPSRIDLKAGADPASQPFPGWSGTKAIKRFSFLTHLPWGQSIQDIAIARLARQGYLDGSAPMERRFNDLVLVDGAPLGPRELGKLARDGQFDGQPAGSIVAHAIQKILRDDPEAIPPQILEAFGFGVGPPLRQLTEAEAAPRRFLKADHLLKNLKRQDEVTERELSFTGLREWLKAKGAERVSLADVRVYMRVNGTRTNTYMMGGMTQLDFATEARRASVNLESALDLAGAPLDIRKAAGKELRENITARERIRPHAPDDTEALVQGLMEAQHKELRWYKDAVKVLQAIQPYLHDGRVADAAQEYYNFIQKMVRRRQMQGGTRTTTYFENTPKNPGGKENYREMTLTLPVEHIFSKPRRPGLREMGVEKAKDLKGYSTRAPHHFGSKVADADVPWVHIRMSDRFLEDGTKVLGIDEIQSDWLQGALRRGTSVAENKRLIEGYESTLEEIAKKEAAPNYYTQADEQLEQLQTQKEKIKRYLKVAKDKGPVAPNPFQDGWEKTTMRRILAYAADNGYDQVAFSSGDHVASFVGGRVTGQRAFYDTVLPGAAKNALKNVDPKATFGYAKIKTIKKTAERPEIPVKPEGWTRESALARLEAEIAGREEFARTTDVEITRYSDHTNEQVRRILRGDVEGWDTAKGRLGGSEVGNNLKLAVNRVVAGNGRSVPPEAGDMRLITEFIGVLTDEEAATLLGLRLIREGVPPEGIVDTNKFFTVKLSREGVDVIREKGFALYQKNAPKAQTGWQMRQLADGSTELTSTEIRAARQVGEAPAAAKLPDPSMSPEHLRPVSKRENNSLLQRRFIKRNDPRWQEGGEIASVGGMRFPADHYLASQEIIQPNLAAIPDFKASGSKQVYHETSLRNLKDILMGAEAPGPRHANLWVSDDIDLALGQGGQKYLLEFDPRLVNGDVPRNLANESLIKAGQKAREYQITQTLHGSVRAITVPNKRGVQSLMAMANRGGNEGRLGKHLLNTFDFDNITETAKGLRIPRKKQRLLDIGARGVEAPAPAEVAGKRGFRVREREARQGRGFQASNTSTQPGPGRGEVASWLTAQPAADAHSGKTLPTLPGPNTWIIENLQTEPGLRRLGYANDLVDDTLNELRRRGVTKAILWVVPPGPDTPGGAVVFRKLGFKEMDVPPILGYGGTPGRWMELDLTKRAAPEAPAEVFGAGLTFKVENNILRVKTAEIPEAMRGKGYGTDLYLQAMQHAKAKGLGFASDVAPDPDALAVYNRLIEAGIPLRRTTDVTGAKPVQRFVMDAADLKRTDIDAARATFRHKVEGVAKGATQFVEDGKAIIYGFKQADLTTALHELGHVFRRDLTGDDLRIMEKWCGVKTGKWTVEAEEKFARGFENYMASGEAPNADMREIFEKLKVWITEIYRGIKNTPLDEQIPDNIKAVYRRMLDDAPPNSSPLPRILRHMDSQLVGPPERGNVAALEDLVQEALHLGIPGVNQDALLASLKESGTVTFPKAVRGRKVWTLENLGTHQLELESEAQAAKRTKAPSIALTSATHAVAEETPVDRMRNFFSGTGVTTTLIRGGLHTVFGGDPSAAMRTLNPAVRDAAFAAGRTVEQAYGDTIRLVGEGDWMNLVHYLGGEPVKFKTGRDALTSNYDAMGAVSEDLYKFFNGNLPRQHREALLKFVEAIGGADPRRVGRAVELARDPKATAALDYIFNSKEAPAMLAHLREALKLTGAIQPAREGRLLEALLHASNVTARNGVKYDGAGIDRADFVLKAVQDVFGKDKAMRAAVLFGGYGQAVKARQSWVGMGIAIDAKDHKLLLRWLNGMNIPKEELPRIHAMVVKYNLNPTFMSDAVLDIDMYVPKAARERMAQALARGSEMIDPTMKLRGEGFQENNLRSGWALAYRYMKTRMTRGSFFVRQRYFFMNTFDHFTQMAMIVGFRPAFASTLRVIAQDVMVIPGVARAIYIIEKLGGDPQLAEKTRKALQGYGDTLAQFFGSAKYNIHVNHVLEGVGADGAKTFQVMDPKTGRVKVYNYVDIRDIAVQEGIFASFDTRALEGAIKKSTNLARTDWIDARHGLDNANAALNKVQDTFADFTGMVTETAETWSERERLGGMITLMEQGVDPRTAARLTIDALYDYAGSMTKFDRNIMVNLMFPFWAFQKNANRQVINAMFSPWGAYRMGVLRRVHELGPDVMTHLLYDRVVEPYGLDVDAMPPDLQDTYWTLRNAIEYGRGDLEDLRASPGGDELVAEVEAVFGPVSQMKPEIRLFLENGYGGPQNVPPNVVRVIRAYFANTSVKAYDESGEGKLKGAGMFTVTELLQKRILSYHPDTSEYYVPKPSAAGRRSYMRDRSGFALTADRKKAVRDWMAMVPGDHPYVELYLPDSTINAGFRHSTVIAAMTILGISAAVTAGTLPFKEDDGDLWLHTEALPTLLETLGDPLGAPVPALLQNFLVPESEASRWGRVHPWTAQVFETLTGVELVTIPEQRKQGMEEGPEVPLELVGVKRKGYKLMPPGTFQICFRNSPLGELNDILLRWDKAPLEERMGIQGELTRWARGVAGMQTSIVSRKESARKLQRPVPPRPE